MSTLTLTAHVSDDRKLTLQLPPHVTPGEHEVRIEIDPQAANEAEGTEREVTPLRWDRGVLVYAGGDLPPESVCDWIEQAREERIQQLLRGSEGCE